MKLLEIELASELTKLESEPTVKGYLEVLHKILNYNGNRQQEFMTRSYAVRTKLREMVK